MRTDAFIATAWNNGSHQASGAGYGLKLSKVDRDRYLKREWKFVTLHFPETAISAEVNIDNDSFWNDTCRELRHQKIGAWLIRNGLAPWPHGAPPKVKLAQRAEGAFDVSHV